MFLAHEWQKGLDDGTYKSQGDIARQLGTTQPHVSQVLSLLRLAPSVVKTLTDLGPVLGRPFISQKELRAMLTLPAREQRRRVKRMLAEKGIYPLKL
jgi:hypothetical protein